jgi:molecular chaperone HscA
MLRRVLTEARVEARRSLSALESALGKDGDLLSSPERAAIDRARARLEEAAKGQDRDAIRLAMEALEDETRAFAERRMDRGIREALAGVKVEELERGMSGAAEAGQPAETGETAARRSAAKP